MEQPPPLLQRREGAVLVLSNNNPAARNALSPAFYAALTEALAQAEADPPWVPSCSRGRGRALLRGRRPAPVGQSAVSCPLKSAAPSSKACTT